MLENPKIVEIYGPVIQGEGAVIGMPTVFIRTGGCDFRCSWCDSAHAVQPANKDRWHPMTADEIVSRVKEVCPAPVSVTFSGGNPAIQPLGDVIEALRDEGYGPLVMETQGTVAPAWLDMLDLIVVSPKPPSSHQRFDFDQFTRFLDNCGETPVAPKIVVFEENDLIWAQTINATFGERFDYPLTLQVGNPDHQPGAKTDTEALLQRYRDLVDWTSRRHMHDVRVLPQLHVLAWGGGEGV